MADLMSATHLGQTAPGGSIVLPQRQNYGSSYTKLSHEPLSGVYSGMTPWANSQVTIELLRCPARLSQIRIKRSGGSGRCGRCPNHVAQSAAAGSSVRWLVGSGSAAKICRSSSFSQGCNTTLGALGTPLARTSPVAGRNSVSNLAVPPRMYSCG